MVLFKFIFMAILMNTFAYEPVTENDWFPGQVDSRSIKARENCICPCPSDPDLCDNGGDGSRMLLPNQGRWIYFFDNRYYLTLKLDVDFFILDYFLDPKNLLIGKLISQGSSKNALVGTARQQGVFPSQIEEVQV